METWPRPKIGRRFSSALIMRRFFESWRPFRLMYCQSFLVTSVRGIGELPTTEARSLLGCIGFMNAAFGVRFLPEDFRRLIFRPPFLAAFLDDFLVEVFREEVFFPPLLFFFLAILAPGFGDRMGVATESETPSVRGENYSAVVGKQ